MAGNNGNGKDTRFKPGNQHGKKKALAPEVREAAKFCRKTLQAKLKDMMVATTDDLDAIIKDKSEPAINVIFARLISKAAKGDLACANAILDRSVGKVKENIEVALPRPMIVENLDGAPTIMATQEVIDIEAEENK